MKKYTIVLFGVILSALLCVTPVVAQEQPENASLASVFEQLKEEEIVTEIWLPLLPNDYQIDDVTIYEDGSYAFSVSFIGEDKKVMVYNLSIVTKNATASSDAKLSPFQAWLKRPESLNTSWQDVLTQMQSVKDVVYFKDNEADVLFGPVYQTFQNKDAAAMMWRASGGSNTVPSDVFEVAVSLSKNMVGSVLFRTDVVGSFDIWQLFTDEFPMVFTTLGDADANGMVNAADALALLKHTVGKNEITDAIACLMADCNDDGIMNADDALAVLKKVVGK